MIKGKTYSSWPNSWHPANTLLIVEQYAMSIAVHYARQSIMTWSEASNLSPYIFLDRNKLNFFSTFTRQWHKNHVFLFLHLRCPFQSFGELTVDVCECSGKSLFTYLCLCIMIGRWWRLLRCVEEALCFSVSSRSVGQSDGINGWQRAEWWGQWDMRQGVKSLPCRPLTHSWEDWLLENIINSQRNHNYLSSQDEF